MARQDIDDLRKSLMVPLSIFGDRRLGVLESLVRHLRETKGLKNTEIAKLLSRDDRTIWTVYNRTKQKLEKK